MKKAKVKEPKWLHDAPESIPMIPLEPEEEATLSVNDAELWAKAFDLIKHNDPIVFSEALDVEPCVELARKIALEA